MVEQMCDHVAWLNRGSLMDVGKAAPTIKAYRKSISTELD
jgi:ABC-type polysaccharide/polyol phosphate transport system ATPase subunit